MNKPTHSNPPTENELTQQCKVALCDALRLFLSSRRTRHTIKRFDHKDDGDALNQLYVDLVANSSFVRRLSDTSSDGPLRRLVHIWARFYLLNFLLRQRKRAERCRPFADFSAHDNSDFERPQASRALIGQKVRSTPAKKFLAAVGS